MAKRKEKELTSHSEAFSLVLENVGKVPKTEMALSRAVGFPLRKSIRADRPLPPFNRSAMDGYATRSSDFKNGRANLHIAGELPAGGEWKGNLTKGECVKIMTGAPVPQGADCVVKVEQSCRSGSMVDLAQHGIKPWLNIHRKGADAKKGQILLEKGRSLSPLGVAVAGSVGAVMPEVSRKIKVTVIATGGELLSPESGPKPYRIRDANSPLLMSRLAVRSWAEPKFAGIVKDAPRKLEAVIKKALGASDVVLTTGGVSMGDADCTHRVFASLGVKQIFHKVAIRPGKPVWFGVFGKTAVFGLPGNPVSVAVTFHEFVVPALKKMAGFSNTAPATITLPLADDVTKKHGLREFRLAVIEQGGAKVAPVSSYQGSGDFVSAAKSDGVMVLPEAQKEFKAGALMEFHPWE